MEWTRNVKWNGQWEREACNANMLTVIANATMDSVFHLMQKLSQRRNSSWTFVQWPPDISVLSSWGQQFQQGGRIIFSQFYPSSSSTQTQRWMIDVLSLLPDEHGARPGSSRTPCFAHGCRCDPETGVQVLMMMKVCWMVTSRREDTSVHVSIWSTALIKRSPSAHSEAKDVPSGVWLLRYVADSPIPAHWGLLEFIHLKWIDRKIQR